MVHTFFFFSTFILLGVDATNLFMKMYGKKPLYRSEIVTKFVGRIINMFVLATLISFILSM